MMPPRTCFLELFAINCCPQSNTSSTLILYSDLNIHSGYDTQVFQTTN
jgi:hypothetical protein